MAQYAHLQMTRIAAVRRFDGWEAVRMAIVLGCAAALIFAGDFLPAL